MNQALKRKNHRFSIANEKKYRNHHNVEKMSVKRLGNELFVVQLTKDTRLKWKRKWADRIIYEFAFKNFASRRMCLLRILTSTESTSTSSLSLFLSMSPCLSSMPLISSTILQVYAIEMWLWHKKTHAHRHETTFAGNEHAICRNTPSFASTQRMK